MKVSLEKNIYDCPGEAHILDMRFDPSSQGPYGDGAHYCDVCHGEYMVSYDTYRAEIEYQVRVKEQARRRKIRLEEERQQQILIDKVMTLPKHNL